jgi:hypothetical protein
MLYYEILSFYVSDYWRCIPRLVWYNVQFSVQPGHIFNKIENPFSASLASKGRRGGGLEKGCFFNIWQQTKIGPKLNNSQICICLIYVQWSIPCWMLSLYLLYYRCFTYIIMMNTLLLSILCARCCECDLVQHHSRCFSGICWYTKCYGCAIEQCPECEKSNTLPTPASILVLGKVFHLFHSKTSSAPRNYDCSGARAVSWEASLSILKLYSFQMDSPASDAYISSIQNVLMWLTVWHHYCI